MFKEYTKGVLNLMKKLVGVDHFSGREELFIKTMGRLIGCLNEAWTYCPKKTQKGDPQGILERRVYLSRR